MSAAALRDRLVAGLGRRWYLLLGSGSSGMTRKKRAGGRSATGLEEIYDLHVNSSHGYGVRGGRGRDWYGTDGQELAMYVN